MVSLADLITAGREFGVFQFYLPFMLSFAIIYGILRKIHIFGEETTGKNVDLILSCLLSFFIIGYTPVGITLAEFFGSMFTGTILVIVTMLGSIMILYVLGQVVGINLPLKAGSAKKWILLLSLIVVVLGVGVFFSSGGGVLFPGISLPGFTFPSIPIPALPAIGITMSDVAFLLMVMGTGLIVWWISKEGKPATK